MNTSNSYHTLRHGRKPGWARSWTRLVGLALSRAQASGMRLGSPTCFLVSIEGITWQRTSEVPLWAVNQWLSDWPLARLQAAPVLLARVTGAFVVWNFFENDHCRTRHNCARPS